jgi:hypothetical protein
MWVHNPACQVPIAAGICVVQPRRRAMVTCIFRFFAVPARPNCRHTNGYSVFQIRITVYLIPGCHDHQIGPWCARDLGLPRGRRYCHAL